MTPGLAPPASAHREPLGQVTSIKVKLGLLVAASVTVAAVLATLGAGTVPAALSIPVTVLLALGVTQLLAVGMTSPIRQMTEAAQRMAAGDYAVRVETSSTDEVGQLARAFNRMAADLATVDRERRDLVATVSHELRTPLTALVAVLENLDDGVTEPDPATITVALGQATRLSNLVADLLDLSRVDAGVVALDRSDVPVAALVDEAVTEARSGARGVTFDVRVEPADLMVPGDRSRLHQLLANLLDNAARHSPGGGVVRVWAGRVGDVVRWEVSDEGAGIAPEDRERVFVRFGTLADPTGGGTGLGLAIARWVTDLHGGRIGLVDPVVGETGRSLPGGAAGGPRSHRPRHHVRRRTQEEPGHEHSHGTPGAPGGFPGVARQVDRRRGLRRPLARSRHPRAAWRPARVPGDRGLRRADPAVRRPRARGCPGAAGRGRPGALDQHGSDGGRSPGRARSCAPGSP